ncbi:unnamed protein product [Microthlaspi erraticum]|uniref:Uncharacterized protein n=1 Tax=Microthlaspi erraticum TaxID=1685480 RepID=A0A6D2JDP6_9BRAS|nr:unnamed protein product [Microthlaspi erraticum]
MSYPAVPIKSSHSADVCAREEPLSEPNNDQEELIDVISAALSSYLRKLPYRQRQTALSFDFQNKENKEPFKDGLHKKRKLFTGGIVSCNYIQDFKISIGGVSNRQVQNVEKLKEPQLFYLINWKDIKKKCYSRPQPSYLWRFKEGFKGGSYPIPRNKARPHGNDK